VEAVIWHDVECSAYDLDFDVWRELADAGGGPVLDVGCGTGRTALDLARRGHEVTGIDADPDLIAALSRRAKERSLRVRATVADVRVLDLGKRFALAIAPMQVVQLLGGSDGRRAALRSLRRHLTPGAVFAAALADPFEGVPPGEVLPPMPDIREEQGWVYASTPVAVRAVELGAAIDRHRQAVSPAGEIHESVATIALDLVSPEAFEDEGRAEGFAIAGRRWIPDSAEWTGSTVVLLEAP
jgi:SAM-dependent methyltransferase